MSNPNRRRQRPQVQQPTQSQQPVKPAMKVLTVLIDPGHGHNTPGKRSQIWPDGTQLFEYDFNRKLASKLATALHKFDFIRPIMVVNETSDVGLSVRCARANNYDKNASIYVSLHGNAAASESARGWEVWTSPGQTKSDLLATCIYEAIHRVMPNLKLRSDTSDGDVDKESKFYVLIHTAMPAVLTENGFFTNEDECHQMMTDVYQDKIVEGHVQGIIEYYNKYYNI